MSYTKILQFILCKPRLVYGLVLIAVVASAAMVPNLHIDTDPENMLDANNSARVFHNKVKHDFSMRDMIVIGAVSTDNIFTPHALQTLHELSEKVLQIDGVIAQDLLSLSVLDNISQEENGGIRFEYLMRQAPTTLEGSLEIQESIKRLPLLNNTLASSNGKAIAIYVPIEAKNLSYEIAEKIRGITAQLNSPLTFHITGFPVAEDQFGVEMFVQMGIAAPLAGLAIFILLWFFFRSIALIIAPMIVAMATVVIIMGTLIGFGFTVHIMSSMIAIFLMPIAVVDSVHILSEFSDCYKKGDDVNRVITKIMGHLFTPMLFTSVTSAVGFYSLLLTPIPPVKVFGAFIGTGILLAFVLTITFIPAYISRLSPQALNKLQAATIRIGEKGALAYFLEKLGLFSRKYVKLILIVFIAIFAISVEGIRRIEINDNPVNWFKADHEIRIADKALNQHFAGTYDAWLVFEKARDQNPQVIHEFMESVNALKNKGIKLDELNHYIANNQSDIFTQNLLVIIDDLEFSVDDLVQDEVMSLYDMADNIFTSNQLFLQPDILNWISELQNNLVATGLVGKVNSLSDIVKTVNRELHTGENIDFVLPKTAAGISQTLLQYQSSHRPQDLWHFVSKDYQQTLLWLQLTSGDNQHTSRVVSWVNDYIAENPAPFAINFQWAGKLYINIVWQDAMVKGMLSSLLSSFVIVFIMMAGLFRSVKYGILAMLPLSFTITLIYGLIGWFGKPYDMPIAVLSALTLGLSIDFSIHFLQRVRELEKKSGSLITALKLMFQEPSRAIARNAIVIAIGFTPLLLSPLMPYITVGFFLASIMAASAFVTLVLLPALLTLLNSKKTA